MSETNDSNDSNDVRKRIEDMDDEKLETMLQNEEMKRTLEFSETDLPEIAGNLQSEIQQYDQSTKTWSEFAGNNEGETYTVPDNETVEMLANAIAENGGRITAQTAHRVLNLFVEVMDEYADI